MAEIRLVKSSLWPCNEGLALHIPGLAFKQLYHKLIRKLSCTH